MKDGIKLTKASRWLIVFILALSTAYVTVPAHAQGFSIALTPSTITTPMNSVVTVTVTLTNFDPFDHVIELSLAGEAGWWWRESFAPNPVVLPAGAVGTSILTLPVPGPNDVCPGQSSPGPYYMQFTVRGADTAVPGGAIVTASLIVNLLPAGFPLVISIEPSKPSYRVGETVTLTMNSNLPAEYYLKVRKPDGSVWTSAQAYLPATFTKKSSEPLGTYTAELVAYYCGMAQAATSFVVTPDTYDVTISLAGLATDVATMLQVDGNKVADMKGGDVRVMSYPIGTSHTFQVDQYVDGAAGYRYYCASNTWAAGAEGSNVFNYAAQVYLDVSTDPAGITEVTQSGWYAVGSSATISSVPTKLDGPAGTEYRFTEWTVDGASRAGNGFAVAMDAPHKVVAKFDTYFKLTVISDYGNPKGSGYYKAGDTATFSVDSPVGIGIQQVFVEWKGDYSGKDPKGSATMDKPKTVTATWTTSYFQLYLIIAAVAAIVAVVSLLLWRRSRAAPSTVKPPPPPPPSETPKSPAEPSAPTPEPEATSKRPVSIALRCTNCGSELKEGQIYCPECGQKRTD